MNQSDIIIIGGGLAGLTAAIQFHRAGKKVTLLEASDRVGGRLKTDIVDGFRLDRGFQVLLEAYPLCRELLDYEALNLRRFSPGAMMLHEKGKFEIGDPIRNPSSLLKTALAPIGNLLDKWLILKLRYRLGRQSIEEIFNQPEIPTYELLNDLGFSLDMLENFFRPFLSGIFLENALETSSRMFEFVFKMFSEGATSIPALGMEEIPKQLLRHIPQKWIKTEHEAITILGQKVTCQNDAVYEAPLILIASEAAGIAGNYLTQPFGSEKESVTCSYFFTQKAPIKRPLLMLNASEEKYVNNVTVMSRVSEHYAPPGQELISVSHNGISHLDDSDLSAQIRNELYPWFREDVYSWRLLKNYKINYALPKQKSVRDNILPEKVKLREGLYICGDHQLNGSINAAMKSGKEVASLILEGLN